jgi:uncharacterized membrane protein
MSANNFTVKQSKTGAQILSSLFLVVCLFTPGLTSAQNKTAADKGSTFTAQLVNIEAAVHEAFHYNTTLHNGAAQARIYELTATLPDGWNVIFRTRGSQVTSVNMDGARGESISIEIHPAYSAAPGKYKIPVMAVASNDTLRLGLEAVIKGSYGMELTTPTGLLSANITEGKQKEIHLVVKNTGTLNLADISLAAQTPAKWDATFNPAKIEQLEPGKTADVVATLAVPDKTIAGDYVTTFTARNNASNAQAVFRMTVKTSVLSGWIGIMVILAAIALVYFLIRKYGRR